jgi:hypothetical protein
MLSCSGAQAQMPLEQAAYFALKPRSTLSLMSPTFAAESQAPVRLNPLTRIPVDDHDHDLRVAVQRQTRRFALRETAAPLSLTTLPRSRFTRYAVEDRLPIGDHILASIGWQGIKLSNRNANVTVGAGNERLRARDWFLPRAALVIEVGSNLSMTLDYNETLRAYAETGTIGPLGLTQDDFRTLRRDLKPETHSRMQLRANWTPLSDLTLSLTAHGGQLDDRIVFADRSYLPINSGSARIEGMILGASQQLSQRLRWSVRYSEARLHISGSNVARENSLSVEGLWEGGPCRVTARAARSSAPALEPRHHRPLRMEAGMDYAIAHVARRPLRLAARLTDPDRLASTAFALGGPPGPLRAADQAHSLMVSALLDW